MDKKLKIYDTTLRDGAQTFGISFSKNDKIKISKILDDFNIDYIEAGWPGSNPKDKDFFEAMKKQPLSHSKLVAFGSTKKPYIDITKDRQIQDLIDADTPVIAIVAKFSQTHTEKILKTSLKENLKLIAETVSYLKSFDKEVIVDAEHFFDGFKENPEYVQACAKTAFDNGADNITLCDTNGGSTPNEIKDIVRQLYPTFPAASFGIHCHNDCELAVANSIEAVANGIDLIQGTINGYGERCGNANLISLIPTLKFKFHKPFSSPILFNELTSLANKVANISNKPLHNQAAYVGQNAFTHKGGIHVSAVAKLTSSYEHIDPTLVGNRRDFTISELSGRSNIKLQATKLNLDLADNETSILSEVKELENKGLSFENANGTFEMLVRKYSTSYQTPFELVNVRVQTQDLLSASQVCEATIKVRIANQIKHVVSEANGPVDSINKALLKALIDDYPFICSFQLTDYKVSIIDPENAASAKTRVWVEAKAHGDSWSTVGFGENILQASTQALADSYELFLHKYRHKITHDIYKTHEEHENGNNYAS